jgi:hypothetical protein
VWTKVCRGVEARGEEGRGHGKELLRAAKEYRRENVSCNHECHEEEVVRFDELVKERTSRICAVSWVMKVMEKRERRRNYGILWKMKKLYFMEERKREKQILNRFHLSKKKETFCSQTSNMSPPLFP